MSVSASRGAELWESFSLWGMSRHCYVGLCWKCRVMFSQVQEVAAVAHCLCLHSASRSGVHSPESIQFVYASRSFQDLGRD